ncbi:hypothetical protein AKJ41_01290 [candidate division MSBL1 archaeon SCGC-AAA259O05]|uniref:Uncharacterized protein n=1 Tax=candidate division MSBL1 archaeon SCGC-AAA259O05 TaxID=1698271 RepID=A0A133V502_9EURY|nr:hypothetical protein AKJ41_01290 [candidate division MSBL1 archaeon SCGC-AAA259O05]
MLLYFPLSPSRPLLPVPSPHLTATVKKRREKGRTEFSTRLEYSPGRKKDASSTLRPGKRKTAGEGGEEPETGKMLNTSKRPGENPYRGQGKSGLETPAKPVRFDLLPIQPLPRTLFKR